MFDPRATPFSLVSRSKISDFFQVFPKNKGGGTFWSVAPLILHVEGLFGQIRNQQDFLHKIRYFWCACGVSFVFLTGIKLGRAEPYSKT